MPIGRQGILKLTLSAVLVLGIAGCGVKPPAHKQNMNAANARWLQLRSGLMLQMAQQQFDTGDLEQADKTLLGAAELDPKNPRLHLLAGRVALERGQLELAYRRFDTAVQFEGKLGEAYYYQGVVMQRWQRFDLALERYQKAYEFAPERAAYLLAVSEMLVALDRQDEAMQLLAERATYFEQNAGIRVALGQLHAMRQEHGKAAHYFYEASMLRPDDVQIVEELAVAQISAGRNGEAIRTFEKLVDHPTMANRRDLKRALAVAYRSAGRNADARRVYVALTQEDPRDAEAWSKLSELALESADLAGAMLAANRVISLAPDRQEGFMVAGLVLQKRGRLEEALQMFDRAAAAAPRSTEPVILRGIALERAGRSAAAAAAYAEALRRQPQDTRAQSLLANVTQSQP